MSRKYELPITPVQSEILTLWNAIYPELEAYAVTIDTCYFEDDPIKLYSDETLVSLSLVVGGNIHNTAVQGKTLEDLLEELRGMNLGNFYA